MWDEFVNHLYSVFPKGSTLYTCVGACVGALVWALGGIDIAIQWLFAFTVIDYLTGNIAALKTGEWNSSTGYRGLIKKVIIFVIVAVCNGLDQVIGSGIFRSAAIVAYSVNEAGSIIENIDRLGLGSRIPSVLRNGLRDLRVKNEIKEDKHE